MLFDIFRFDHDHRGMNKHAAANPDRERRSQFVHMLWPSSLKTSVARVAKASGLSMTEVFLRVYTQAEKQGVLLDWITRVPDPRPQPQPEALPTP